MMRSYVYAVLKKMPDPLSTSMRGLYKHCSVATVTLFLVCRPHQDGRWGEVSNDPNEGDEEGKNEIFKKYFFLDP